LRENYLWEDLALTDYMLDAAIEKTGREISLHLEQQNRWDHDYGKLVEAARLRKQRLEKLKESLPPYGTGGIIK